MGHGNFLKRPLYRHIMYHGDIRLKHFDGNILHVSVCYSSACYSRAND